MGTHVLDPMYVSPDYLAGLNNDCALLTRLWKKRQEGKPEDRALMRMRELYNEDGPEAYVKYYKVHGILRECRIDRFLPDFIPPKDGGVLLKLNIGDFRDEDFGNVALREFDKEFLVTLADDVSAKHSIGTLTRIRPIAMMAASLRFVAAERTHTWKWAHGKQLMPMARVTPLMR